MQNLTPLALDEASFRANLIPCSLLSILFITGLTFTPGRLSPEAPKHGIIFDFL